MSAPGREPRALHGRTARPLAVSVLAVVLLAIGGLVGWIAIEQLNSGSAPAWAAEALSSLGSVKFGDVAILVVGIILALIGLWLLILAIAPGSRSRVAVSSQGDVPGSTVMPVSDIARRVRIRAQQVDGVERVDVHATPKTVQVMLTTPVDDTASVRENARLVVQQAISEIAPARPLNTRVRVRRS